MEKLIEYRKFKEAAADLRDREQRQASVFFREVALPKLARADGDDELSGDLDALLVAFSRVLRFVDAKGWHLVTEDEHSVEEKMDLIERRLAAEGRLAVEEIFRECRSKLELIVCLLAMLELAHLRAVRIEQQEAHGAIYLFAVEPATAVAGDDRPPAKIVEMTPAEPAETELP
jgi:segregation and condensation protein A